MILENSDQFVACCPPIRPTDPAQGPVSFLVITVGPAGAPAGPYTITLTGIVLGSAQDPQRFVGVATTSDLPSALVNSVRIGGVVKVICP